MATTETSFSNPNNLSIGNNTDNSHSLIPADSVFEFHESDIYPSDETRSPDFTKTISERVKTKSKPIDVPDWSKILKDEYTGNRWGGMMDDGDYDKDEEDWMPPHEITARQVARDRTRVVSFSMHEGIGRTLKGRDLRMVRSAVFAKFGFAD